MSTRTPGTSSDDWAAAYTVLWKGEQHIVHGRDREHAKRILYMVIPEAKWTEIK